MDDQLTSGKPMALLCCMLLKIWGLALKLLRYMWKKMAMKKRKTQGKQMPHLPEEIIKHLILERLPLQSLLRFSCTCKRWCSFIFSDSKFNKAHLDLANRPSWKLIPDLRNETTIDCDCNISTTTHPNTLTNSSFLRGNNSILLGSCNGILFIRVASKKLLLWNPYVNSMKWIKECISCIDYSFMNGLTYDRVTDDYKVIAVTLFNNDKLPSPNLFSLRKNSWKKLSLDLSTVNIGKTVWHQDRLGITLNNGICYWKVELEIGRSGIICFDPVVEEFKDVPLLPDMLCRSTGRLGTLDGCLSLIHVCSSVWVMKEYGCWTKLFDLGGLTYVGNQIYMRYKPVGYNSSKDQVVVLDCRINFGCFWIVDINKGVRRSPFSSTYESHNFITNICNNFNVNIYTESLMCPWLDL